MLGKTQTSLRPEFQTRTKGGWLQDVMVDGVKNGRQIKEAKTWQLLWSDGIDEMIMDIQQSCFNGVMLAVGRLVGIEKTRPLETSLSVSRDFTTHIRLFWIWVRGWRLADSWKVSLCL